MIASAVTASRKSLVSVGTAAFAVTTVPKSIVVTVAAAMATLNRGLRTIGLLDLMTATEQGEPPTGVSAIFCPSRAENKQSAIYADRRFHRSRL
jgi:hypothetical protein